MPDCPQEPECSSPGRVNGGLREIRPDQGAAYVFRSYIPHIGLTISAEFIS